MTNNFNALRLFAAFAVLFSHSFALAYGGEWAEPLWHVSRGQTNVGSVAVIVFFAISGYLITGSFAKRPDPVRFVIARALRILPGLIVVVGVLAFVIGPATSDLPTRAYFWSGQPFWYVAGNMLFYFNDHLPGVFQHNPYTPRGVDGSLWSLHYEVICYGAVLALGAFRLLRWEFVALILLVCVVGQHERIGVTYARLGIPFAAGAVIYLAKMPRNFWASIGCAALSAVSLRYGGFAVVGGICLSYTVLCIGAAPARFITDPAKIFGDLSYGVYIWAFPMEQIAAQLLGHSVSWWGIIVISFVPTAALSWLSWHLVEHPSHRLGKYLTAEKKSAAAPTAAA